MKRAFWHIVKAALVCGLIYLFSFITTVGVSVGTNIKLLQASQIFFYILSPIMTVVSCLTVTGFFAQCDFNACMEYYHLPVSERQYGIPFWKELINPYILVECAVALFMFSSLPLPFGLSALDTYIGDAWQISPFLRSAIYVAGEVLIFYLFTAFAYNKVKRMWLHNIVPKEWVPFLPQTKEEHGEPEETSVSAVFFFKKVLLFTFYLAIYWACGIAAPACIIMLIGLGYVLVKFYFIPVAIVALIFTILFFRYLRAMRVRRNFIKQVEHVCDEHGYILSKERHPYRTLFFRSGTESFSIEINKVVYSCTLVGSIKRRTLLMFGKNKVINVHQIRLYCRPIFRFEFTTPLVFEGDSHKLLIVVPDNQNLYVVDHVGVKRMYLGSKIFNYKVFGQDDFLGNLSRNSLLR